MTDFVDEYKFLYGEYLRYKTLGFNSYEDLFASIPQLVQIKENPSGKLCLVPSKEYAETWREEENQRIRKKGKA